MEDCIFCKIAKGEIPAHVVYEDDNFLAFLDANPRAPGHVQVIPKEHHRWVWDVPNVGEYFEVARKIAKAQQKAFNVEMIRSQVFGDEVAHAHVWVWPASPKTRLAGARAKRAASRGGPGETTSHDPKDFEGNAEKIKRSLS